MEVEFLSVSRTDPNDNKSLPGRIASSDPNKQTVLYFDLTGEIDITGNLVIDKPNIYIAAETAAWPGIFLTGGTVVVQDASNVVLSHLNIWPGNQLGVLDGPIIEDLDCVRFIATGDQPMIDNEARHCSLLFGSDENGSRWNQSSASNQGASDMKWTSNVIAYCLENAGHPKGPHSKGMIIGDDTGRTEIRRNLFAHNHDRNPLFGVDQSVWCAENLIYDSGVYAAHVSQTGPLDLALERNVHLIGPQSRYRQAAHEKPIFWIRDITADSQIYAEQNEGFHGVDVPSNIVWEGVDEAQIRVSDPPPNTADPNEVLWPLSEVVGNVLDTVGPKYRHRVIADLVEQVRQKRATGIGEGRLVSHEAEVGGMRDSIAAVPNDAIRHTLPSDPQAWREWLAVYEAGYDPAQSAV